MKLTSFVRPALRASSAPTTKNRSRSRAGPLKAGRVLRGHPSGLGLDRPEHGGRISQSGRKRAHSSKFKPLVFGYFHAAANKLSDAERATLGEIGHRLGRKALAELATVARPDTILAWYRKLVARKFDGSRSQLPQHR